MLGVTGCHTSRHFHITTLFFDKMHCGSWAANAASCAVQLPHLWCAFAKEDLCGAPCDAQRRALSLREARVCSRTAAAR